MRTKLALLIITISTTLVFANTVELDLKSYDVLAVKISPKKFKIKTLGITANSTKIKGGYRKIN